MYKKITLKSSSVLRHLIEVNSRIIGRAGRVSDGHCFRMISSRMFEDLTDYCTPEMKVSFSFASCDVFQIIVIVKVQHTLVLKY